MKKTRLVTGLILLALALVIATAGSILVINNFSESKVAEVQTTGKVANNENVLKSDNKTDKLSTKSSKEKVD